MGQGTILPRSDAPKLAQTSPKLASGSAVSLFKFNAQDIRVVTLDGAPWFVAADTCRALCIHLRADGTINTANALRKLDPNEVTAHRVDGQKGLPVKLVSESGLYGLVMASRKPEAQDFKRWVRQVVLPSIRKDGGYVLDEEKVVSGAGPSATHQNITNHLTEWRFVVLWDANKARPK